MTMGRRTSYKGVPSLNTKTDLKRCECYREIQKSSGAPGPGMVSEQGKCVSCFRDKKGPFDQAGQRSSGIALVFPGWVAQDCAIGRRQIQKRKIKTLLFHNLLALKGG
jgi:hypothetical protein